RMSQGVHGAVSFAMCGNGLLRSAHDNEIDGIRRVFSAEILVGILKGCNVSFCFPSVRLMDKLWVSMIPKTILCSRTPLIPQALFHLTSIPWMHF
ncbi:MAG: hypothetical protein ACO264_12515, partial [Burkholderiaceae bacterium]